jgi:hypothetical protein
MVNKPLTPENDMKITIGALHIAILAAGVATAAPASAATLLYSFAPVAVDGDSFTFNVDDQLASIDPTVDGFPVEIRNYMKNGIVETFVTNAFFYAVSNGGGLGVNGFFPYGAQLYSGDTSRPTLLTGSFALYGTSAHTDQQGTLNVTTTVAGVPEPATWGMMMMGFGGIGFAMRRRRQMTALSYA